MPYDLAMIDPDGAGQALAFDAVLFELLRTSESEQAAARAVLLSGLTSRASIKVRESALATLRHLAGIDTGGASCV